MRSFWFLVIVLIGLLLWPAPVMAQSGPAATPTPDGSSGPIDAPGSVDVYPKARDDEIQRRLLRILQATGWFVDPQVEVEEGVVFLKGQTRKGDYKTWAGDLARNTQDVVAVVNQIELIVPSLWDVQPALTSLRDIWVNLLRSIPMVGFSLLVLLITWLLSRVGVRAARGSFGRRLANPLLSNVASYVVGMLIFLVGLYVVLRVAGLTSVAMTVAGGTGLLGLVLGIAFRDITENFLASIFLSMQNPFRTGDLVKIVDMTGFVQALTTRVTVLMTLDGNQVQIPNATVYKSNIINYTSNPNTRVDFVIGIGYDDPISTAQKVALNVLENHPAVLKDPEPWVLVDGLGSATVNLRIYFWLDGSQHSMLKVKSSLIRLVKRAFQEAGISMPDEAREMIFPDGLPLRWVEGEGTAQGPRLPHSPVASHPAAPVEAGLVETESEAGLRSEADDIQAQARQSWKPEKGENLLEPSEEKKE